MRDWLKRNAIRISAAAAVLVAGSVLLMAACAQQVKGRDALWLIVHNLCVPGEIQKHDPAPCAAVNLEGGAEKGFAVLKDISGGTQFLLIPTAQIAGIESPALLAAGSANYFEDAWKARSFIDQVLHKVLPRDDISLAINSAASRSQDQLHIHIDCVRADVREALRKHLNEIKTQWTQLGFTLAAGHRYRALWVSGDNLSAADPFKLLAQGVPGAAKEMDDQTIAVIGVTRGDGAVGFIVLDDQVNRLKMDFAHSEEVQDHECRVAVPADSSRN